AGFAGMRTGPLGGDLGGANHARIVLVLSSARPEDLRLVRRQRSRCGRIVFGFTRWLGCVGHAQANEQNGDDIVELGHLNYYELRTEPRLTPSEYDSTIVNGRRKWAMT